MLEAYAPVPRYGWGAIAVEPAETAFSARDAELKYDSLIYSFIAFIGLLVAFVIIRFLGQLDTYRQREKIVLDSIGDGLVVIDRAWRITLWNDAAARISGWSKDEAMGKPLRSVLKFMRAHDRKENIMFIEHAMVAGEPATLENNTVLVRKDGSEVHVGDSASPIKAQDGSVAGAVVIFRDVTAELQARSTKSDFAYATHQFRTPVTKASWAIQSALDEKEPKKVEAALKDAGTALQSLVRVVNDLTAVSEIDQDMVVPHPEEVGVSVIVDAAVAAAKEKAGRPDAKVVVDHASPAAIVETDIRLLIRAVGETIANAIVYGPEASTVNVTTRVHDKDLIVEVDDSGIGIPESERPLTFHKFFRGSSVDTTGIVGAGLGLYIAERYMSLIGGKIWFRGEAKGGTSFFISVPLRRAK